MPAVIMRNDSTRVASGLRRWAGNGIPIPANDRIQEILPSEFQNEAPESLADLCEGRRDARRMRMPQKFCSVTDVLEGFTILSERRLPSAGIPQRWERSVCLRIQP